MKLLTIISGNETLKNTSLLLGRLGLSAIFILAGMNKIQNYDGTQAYMSAMGVSPEMLPMVIALEVVGGLLILLGGFTQLLAIALAGFSIVSALLFHLDLGDQMQFILFFKNIAMAGGFMALAASGAGAYSLDVKFAAKAA